MVTTFRAQNRAALVTLLTGFQSANPNLLDAIYPARPGSFNDRITGYVGPLNETMIHSGNALVQRRLTPTVVLVTRLSDPESEQADIVDLLVDAFLDYCSARPHAVNNVTQIQPTSVEQVELEVDGAFYPACIIGFLSLEERGRYP
jgi:hypothetical protein